MERETLGRRGGPWFPSHKYRSSPAGVAHLPPFLNDLLAPINPSPGVWHTTPPNLSFVTREISFARTEQTFFFAAGLARHTEALSTQGS